jgi:DNA-binding transcriptional MerR regulator/methylmalonyl-CoA mutase cobalamin-binding subunit
MAESIHTIQSVVRRTGLTAHVIRVWERRYGAVKPGRTLTNRRRYSEEEVERLALLRDLTRDGYSIGAVAQLPDGTLRQLATQDHENARQTKAGQGAEAAPALLEMCAQAIQQLDSRRLEEALRQGSVELGAMGLLQRLIAPLVQRLGELWRDGTITAAHEHFATAVIRVFLGRASGAFSANESAPVLVVATPTGQLHELGALLAAATAANLGWRVTYLGGSLPAAEIAGAARQNRATAVALSLVYPEDDPRLETELASLRELLPREVSILAGGRAVSAYRPVLERLGIVTLRDLADLGSTLDRLRQPVSLR